MFAEPSAPLSRSKKYVLGGEISSAAPAQSWSVVCLCARLSVPVTGVELQGLTSPGASKREAGIHEPAVSGQIECPSPAAGGIYHVCTQAVGAVCVPKYCVSVCDLCDQTRTYVAHMCALCLLGIYLQPH